MWPAAQMQRLISLGLLDPGQESRDEIGELDPACRRVEDVGGDLEAAPDLRPEPLRGVDAADGGEVLRGVLAGRLRDRRRLRGAGVVLPEPRLRRQVTLPLRVEGQGLVPGVDRDRCRSGGVDADPDDARRLEAGLARRLRERAFHGGAQALDVVGGALAGEVRILRIEQDALLARGVVGDVRPHGATVLAIDDDRTNGVRPVVETDGVAGLHVFRDPLPTGSRPRSSGAPSAARGGGSPRR